MITIRPGAKPDKAVADLTDKLRITQVGDTDHSVTVATVVNATKADSEVKKAIDVNSRTVQAAAELTDVIAATRTTSNDSNLTAANIVDLVQTNAVASDMSIDTVNFDKNLSSTDNTIQKALDTLDELVVTTTADPIYQATQLRNSEDNPLRVSHIIWGYAAQWQRTTLYEDIEAYTLYISADGLNIYSRYNGASTAERGIASYTLGSAWDITTIIDTSKKFKTLYSVAYGDSSIVGMTFSPDGTKLYLLQYHSNTSLISEYTLSIPWDITTMTLDSNVDISADITYQVMGGIDISSDGTKLFISTSEVSGTSVVDFRIHELQLTTPWTLLGYTYNVLDEISIYNYSGNNLHDIRFADNGNTLYIAPSIYIHRFILSTPWKINTAVFDISLPLSPPGITIPRGSLFINSSINKAFVYVAYFSAWYVREYMLPPAGSIDDNYYEFILPANFTGRRITDLGVSILKASTLDITFNVAIGNIDILTTPGTILAGNLFSNVPTINSAVNLIPTNTILRVDILTCKSFEIYGLSIWVEAT